MNAQSMRTFADLKCRFAVGVKVRLTYHRYAEKLGENWDAIRAIKQVQSNAIALENPHGDEKKGPSWWYFPKAEFVQITGDNSWTVLHSDTREPMMSYIFVGDSVPE